MALHHLSTNMKCMSSECLSLMHTSLLLPGCASWSSLGQRNGTRLPVNDHRMHVEQVFKSDAKSGYTAVSQLPPGCAYQSSLESEQMAQNHLSTNVTRMLIWYSILMHVSQLLPRSTHSSSLESGKTALYAHHHQ